ncbi:MAG: elongation factor P [Myxococcales bacterium]|jgi:elongation factor P|nr:elongation factor P [Myxococcales bacterium]
MYDTTSFRKNLKIEIEGDPCVILSAQHVKPGKGVAFVKTRFKSLITGRVLERNFRSGDKVGKPDLEEREMQYLFTDGETWTFMDNSNYEQIALPKDAVEEVLDYLIDNLPATILFFKGKAISVEVPTFVELVVAQTDPGVRGDTAQGGSKPATMNTGAVVTVPLYIEEGEVLRIDTRTGEFVDRVKK